MSRDKSGERLTIEHTYDESTPASVAIVQAICAIENVDPVEAPDDLGFTLYDYVNPNALDMLVMNETEGQMVVDLTIEDYRILVSDTGRVRVRFRE